MYQGEKEEYTVRKPVLFLLCAASLLAGCDARRGVVSGDGTSLLPADSAKNISAQGGAQASAVQATARPSCEPKESYALWKEAPHFIIYCLEQDKGCLDDLASGLEAAYAKVTSDLDCPLDYKVPVTVCPDIKTLHSAIGYAGGTGQDDYISAGTIGKNIYLVSPLNPGPVRTYEHMVRSSTMHEFTHVVINAITNSSTWPTDVPRWLNEGVASYEGGPPMPMEILKQQVANRVNQNRLPTFDNLASYGQDFITTGGYFFTLPAGSFFIETYGFVKVKQLILSPDDYQGIFGKSEQDLWDEWAEYVKANYT